MRNPESTTFRMVSGAYRGISIGRPITLFIDAIYQARAKTKERTAAIRGKANVATPYALKAKMPYFFALLKDELGMRESEQLPLDG